MSWVTDSGTITTALTNISYKRIEGSLKTSETSGAKNHKYYSMYLGAPQIEPFTNKKEIKTERVIIEIKYRHQTNAEYDANYDSFLTVQNTICQLGGFVSWENIDFPRNENTNKETIATLEFFYGVRTCP